MTAIAPELFAAQFGDLLGERTFRLELLDFYIAPNEREPYARFLAGEPHDPTWREPWKCFVQQARGAGKRLERVHVVTEPLTEYVHFELTCAYPASVEAGEDVRILPRDVAVDLALPSCDFWLFDDRLAMMRYDEGGNWLSVEFIDDALAVALAARARNVALQHAIPLSAYLGQLTTEERHGSRTA